MVRSDPVIPRPAAVARPADQKSERILEDEPALISDTQRFGGHLPAEATPNQLDFTERWFTAESRLARAIQTPAPAQNGKLVPADKTSTAMTGPT